MAEGQDSTCCILNPLFFSLKDMVLKCMAYHFGKSDIGHTRLAPKKKKNTKITFAYPSKRASDKEKKK